MDPRKDKFKLVMVEFAAHSDMRRRMTLGLQDTASYMGIITLRKDGDGCMIGFADA